MSSIRHPNPGEAAYALARKPVIMVIDDAPVIRSVVQASFRRVGMEAIGFEDGLSAITALARNEVVVPDVLLLDIGMPRMDGYEVARILRTNPQCAHMMIVMLTGKDGVIDKMRSKFVGCRDYITKPFKPSELIKRVCDLLDIPVPPVGH